MTALSNKFLIVGCGSIGARHARNLQQLASGRVGVHDVDVERARALSEDSDCRLITSLDEGLSECPDLTLICTPPSTHSELAIRSVQAGSHVFVEKPLATSIPDAQSLLRAARAEKRLVFVGYNLRFHAGPQKLKEIAESGALGRIISGRVEFGQYLPTWRPDSDYRHNYIVSGEDGGILLEESHEFDCIQWLLGPVDSVFAAAGKLSDLDMEAEDTGLAITRHRNGSLGEIHVDCTQRGYSRSIKLIGTEAVAEWVFHKGVRVIRDGEDEQWTGITPDLNEMYLLELQDVLAQISGENSAAVTGAEGLESLALTLAAKVSAAEERVVLIKEMIDAA